MGSISSQAGIIIAIIAYLVGMLLIGFITSKRNSSVGDFYLGGRQLGPLVTAMSAEASDMSSWLLMGLPGLAYLSGVAEPFWTAIGLAAGTYLNWLFVARRFRNYTVEAGDAITVPEYFSNRYGDKKKILTLISALIIVIFFIPYTASGFAAIGKLFASLFSLDYHVSMIVGALIVIGYTMTGGFLAASLTDLVQSIIMTIALIVVLASVPLQKSYSGCRELLGTGNLRTILCSYDCFHAGVGAWIFWNAAYPSAVYGDQG